MASARALPNRAEPNSSVEKPLNFRSLELFGGRGAKNNWLRVAPPPHLPPTGVTGGCSASLMWRTKAEAAATDASPRRSRRQLSARARGEEATAAGASLRCRVEAEAVAAGVSLKHRSSVQARGGGSSSRRKLRRRVLRYEQAGGAEWG